MAKLIGTVAKQVVARSIAISRAMALADAVTGDGATAIAPVSPKGTDPEGPASFQESLTGKPVESLPANEVDASREMAIAPQSGLPHPAVTISLRVIEGGGRTTEGRSQGRPAYRSSTRGDASNSLRLVHAADLSKTGVSIRSRNS